MKHSTALVVCLIACFSGPKSSDGVSVAVQRRQTHPYASADPSSSVCRSSPPVASLLTALCTPATLNGLPASALASIANTVSATPQLSDALSPAALTALLSAVSSSPSALNRLSPVALLVLLAAASSAPSAVSSVPPSALFPVLEKLSLSGLLPQSSGLPTAVFARLPPIPPPPPQLIVPGPAPGPMLINLPERLHKPPPIVIPSGPPPSIVVSIPRPYPPQPLIAPQTAPGPIVISESPENAGAVSSASTVIPAPAAPNIYFTTHPSKTYPQLEMPRVYALPPGVSPTQYVQTPVCS